MKISLARRERQAQLMVRWLLTTRPGVTEITAIPVDRS